MRPKKPRNKLDPFEDPASIGNILIRCKLITREELLEALEEFSELTIKQMLGEFLVSRGKITQEDLEISLIKQRNMRNGGADHKSFMDICKIAKRTHQKYEEQVEELHIITQELILKTNKGS